MAFLEKTVALGTTDTEVYACPATLSGSAHGLVFSNITSASHTITIKLYSQLTGLTTQVTSSGQVVPANSQFTWAKPINLIAGDKIIASADAISSVVAVVAVYLDQSAQPSSAFVPRGAWSAVANYAVNDIVSSGSSSYVAVTTNLNSSPPSANWMLLAASTAALPLSGGTLTGQLVLPGSSSAIGAILTSAAEVTTIAAAAATGTINYDATTQSVLYYTTSASANWTVNVRASSGTTLNTALATGQSITLAFMVTQGATAFYNTAVTIDGVSVTPKWQGGTAPAAGNAAGIDVYTYTITKTASATYIVLASLTQFK
jgi:hypothetical protein